MEYILMQVLVRRKQFFLLVEDASQPQTVKSPDSRLVLCDFSSTARVTAWDSDQLTGLRRDT